MRETSLIRGPWRFQIDAYEDGEALGYGHDECDTRLWREVPVPIAFDDCGPAMAGYEGVGWFRTEFALTEAQCSRFPAMRFEGVNYNARVWVNGNPAGEHVGGFLPFEIPLGVFARPGANTVAVRVDNTRRQGEVPGIQRGWRPYGGILREVALVVKSPVYIAHCAVSAKANGSLKVTTLIANAGPREEQVGISGTIEYPDGSRAEALNPPLLPVRAAGLEHRDRILFPSPRVWSPETPALYTLTMQLRVGGEQVDEVKTRFGFRTIETRGAELLLNGNPIRLWGFNRHEDSPRTGMTPDPEQARRDLLHMKKLGANFVRLCHYPHHTSTLDLCDEIGLLVMDEIPLYWWNGLHEGEEDCARKIENAQRLLAEMIARDRNHPSIVFWSAGNETAEERPEVAAGNAELVARAKELDPTRLALHVSDRWSRTPHFENDDILAVNGYPGVDGRCWKKQADFDFEKAADWWRGNLARLHDLYPDRPILISEFGYPGVEGVHGGALGEDTQADAILAESKAFDAPFVCGSTIWCYADHPWPEEDFVRRLTRSPYGVVTRSRRLKDACKQFGRAEPPSSSDFSLESPPPGGHTVRMVRPNLLGVPVVPFPDGFGIRAFRPGDEGLWTDIQRDAEPFFGPFFAADNTLFETQFGDDLPGACERIFFIVDSRNCAVGTIGAWYSRDFRGQDWGRIHWVAVRPAFQGRGLARAGLSYALERLAERHERAYLDTSAGRVGAIKLYLDAGFVPDLESPRDREVWQAFRKTLRHPALDTLE